MLLLLLSCNKTNLKKGEGVCALNSEEVKANVLNVIDEYIELCEEQSDSNSIICLIPFRSGETDSIYLSSAKYLKLDKRIPQFYFFRKHRLVLLYSNISTVIKFKRSESECILDVIKRYSVEKGLTEPTIYDPFNWCIIIKKDTFYVIKDLEPIEIIQRIYDNELPKKIIPLFKK